MALARNEILTAFNSPEQSILASVAVEDGRAREPRHVRRPFGKEPNCWITSATCGLVGRLKKHATLPSLDRSKHTELDVRLEHRRAYRKERIELALPLEAINVAGAREKSIRHGHPRTLHLCWACRPRAPSLPRPPWAEQPRLQKPDVEAEMVLVNRVYTPEAQTGKLSVMKQVDEERAVYEVAGRDLYSAATELAAVYRLDIWTVYAELKRLYGGGNTVPDAHLPALAAQIEALACRYRVVEEEVDVALALVKPGGFRAERINAGDVVYTAEITYQKSKEHLLLSWRNWLGRNEGRFGFHYEPYNFDSAPEKDFFLHMLDAVSLQPDQVEDLYFTGGLHDPDKTDFLVEYKGVDGKWHSYSPDCVIRRRDGRCYIVEIKDDRFREDAMDGQNGRKAMAVQQWVGLNPDKLQYEMIFTAGDSVAFNQLKPAKKFIED